MDNFGFISAGGGGGGGTVTSVGLSMPTEYAVANSPVTGADTLGVTWNPQDANKVLAGPQSGGAATPTFRVLASGDIPSLPYVSTTLNSSQIIVGNAGNVATAVAMSGEASINNAGAVTLANSAVISKVLTGFTPAPGTVTATDTILQAIQKLDSNVNLQAASAKLFNYYNFI